MASLTDQSQNHAGTFLQWANSLREWLQVYRPLLLLSSLVFGSGLIYGLGFAKIANLFSLYERPLLNLYTLPHGGEDGLLRVLLAFMVLTILYWWAWRLARHLHGKTAWGIVIAGSLVLGIILLLIYPFDATDLFDNVLRGRILGIYGGNPFLGSTARYAGDPFYTYIGWRGWASAYGPGWELTSSLVARLVGDGMIANVLAYKILPGIFLLVSVGVVAVILREIAPRQALAGTLLLAWNPIVLYETWGNGHNDMAMVFWMLLSMLAVLKQRYTLAILALVAGALFKFIPVLLIPPVLVLGLRAQPTFRRRLIFLAQVTLLSALLVTIAYAPFWEGIKVLNIKSRENLYTSSLPSIAFNLLVAQDWPKREAATLVSHTALALTSLFVLWRSWKVWKRPVFDEIVNTSALILLFYLMISCLWFQNWYSLWPLGLAPLLKPGPTRRMAVLFGFVTLSKQLGVGPLLFWPRPELEKPWLEIWLTLGVMGPPWLYGFANIWKAKHETASV
jgi:alpha-1,6-mannosyltransferase